MNFSKRTNLGLYNFKERNDENTKERRGSKQVL